MHCGDSILTGIGEKLLSQKRRVKIRDFRGAIATVMYENIKPTEAATVGTDIFLWILGNFWENLFYRTPPGDWFWIDTSNTETTRSTLSRVLDGNLALKTFSNERQQKLKSNYIDINNALQYKKSGFVDDKVNDMLKELNHALLCTDL